MKKPLRSIRIRMLAIVALCWLAPTIALGVYIGGVYSASLREKTEQMLIYSTAEAEVQLVQELDRLISLSKDATYDEEFENATNAYLLGETRYEDYYRQCRVYLDRKYSRDPLIRFSTFMALDESKTIMFTTSNIDRLTTFKLVAQDAIIAVGEEIDTYCRFMYIDNQIYLVRNLLNKRLERFGMLVLGIDEEKLLAPLMGGNELWAGHIDILLGDYRHYADPANPFAPDAGPLGLSEQSDALYYTRNISARDYSLAYRVNLDRHTVYQEMDQYRLLTIIMILMLIPVAALVLWFTHRQLTRPLLNLTRASRRMAEGELGETVPIVGDNELSQLGEAYNAMSLRIKQLIDQSYKEEIALRDARIQALQSRINPHFLNNSLELINWQARIDGNEQIVKMIESLSTLINAGLDRENRRVVPLNEELSVAEAYFYFLSCRFGEKIVLKRDVDPVLMKREVPRLVIQTLLENAVEHGIAPVGSGRILLRVFYVNDRMYIDVTNDGKRLTDEDEERIRALLDDPDSAGKERLGIRNINRRLKLIYGEEAGLSLSRDERGDTLARIVIPLRGPLKLHNEIQRSAF